MSSIGAACTIAEQAAPMELEVVFRPLCYKQAAPNGAGIVRALSYTSIKKFLWNTALQFIQANLLFRRPVIPEIIYKTYHINPSQHIGLPVLHIGVCHYPAQALVLVQQVIYVQPYFSILFFE